MISEVFRVIHTADWHLGKILHDQDRHEEHSRFLAFLLKIIKEKNIHVLIIAGDIFDTTTPPPNSLRLYYEFLADVYHTTKCAIVVTSGNHDSPAHLEAPKEVLKALNIHVIGVVPQDLNDALIFFPSQEDPQLAIAALPFLRDKDLRTSTFGESQDEIRLNIQNGIRKRYHDIGNAVKQDHKKSTAIIATGHLTVLGATRSESERDNIHIGGLGVVNTDVFPELFSYIALGHLHRPQKVGKQEHLRYSGSPIPLSFSESADQKEIRFLEFSEGKLIKNDPIEIPRMRQLFQLRTSYSDLESTLNSFQPEPSELAHWVELIIKADDSVGNFHEVIEKLTVGKSYKVIKTLIESSSNSDGLRTAESQDGHPSTNLLGNPQEVFIQRLDQAGIIEPDERESLITAFAELYDIVTESRRKSF
ncbi:MAG: exonuclease subunit SbcD [Parachlamydiaceae bacterium]|nr:exonuclease subunit SbcD [Parachlamydiaceae bacterium]